MIVHYETEVFPDSKETHQLAKALPCCDLMRAHFEKDDEPLCFAEPSDEPRVILKWWEAGYYGDRTDYSESIRFCPFCGAHIQLIEDVKYSMKAITKKWTEPERQLEQTTYKRGEPLQ